MHGAPHIGQGSPEAVGLKHGGGVGRDPMSNGVHGGYFKVIEGDID